MSLLALTLCLMFLLGTNPGARFIAGTVMPRVTKGVTVGQVEGRLVGPLTLHHVALENKRVRVDVGLLRIDLAEWNLTRGKIRVTELRIENVNVEPLVADTSAQSAPPPEKAAARRKPPPVALELGELRDAVVVLPDSTLLRLASARLGGTLDAYRLELE
ncbi:MAG TPA: hypothetical protein VFP10_13260, partial [Candidatus Eisenbacteria bacterium]|nr:hypothetical protein [Candidatus Eisenbacteria bacterium]